MRLFATSLLLASLLVAAPKVAFQVKTDRADGRYDPGETATWTIAVTVDGKPAAGKMSFDLRQGGIKTIRKGDLALVDGKATLTASLEQPGWVLSFLSYMPEGGKKAVRDYAGAIFGAEKIGPSSPEPEDFDAFWQAKIADLHKIPMNVKLTPVDTKDPKIEAWRITLDNVWGTRVQGVIARPKDKKNLPATLIVEGAGVRGLSPRGVIWRARSGWLAMHIIAHDIAPDQPKEFYEELSKTTLKNYPAFGREDREKSYFLRMLLACRRSLDYLVERPEWDGNRLLVTGGSQGGYQSIAAAGLHPQVTHIIVSVPAGCDHTGQLAGYQPGWPGWNTRSPETIKDKAATLATSKYFDCVNFAKRAKCASLVGVGLVDRTCPAPGIFAMFNQLPGPKRIVTMPDVGHGGMYHKRRGEYNRWSGLWQQAILQENPLPAGRKDLLMPIFTTEETAFAEAVGTLTYCNPFLPERIAAERQAAGDAFIAHGNVWSVKAGDDTEAPNIGTISARVEEVTTAVRERLRAPGAKPTRRELSLFRDLVVYTLYYRFVDELLVLVQRGLDPATDRLDCPALYRRFERECRALLDLPGVHVADEDIAHYFACQYQVRRAFNLTFHGIVGGSMATARLRAAVWQSVFTHDMRRYRRALFDRMGDLPVLITGASGTGKEMVARGISMSRHIPFDPKTAAFASVPAQDFFGINLSAITPTLIESALFGHRRGAFTGALEDREGWLQVCGPHGTVFLDEIGDVTPEIQVKLLRVLETRSFQRIGDTQDLRFQGKLTAATNRDLGAEIDAGRFRADLYYRLCGDLVRTPSLAEQISGSPAELQNLTLFVAGKLVPDAEAEALTTDVLNWIEHHLGADYAWPGNVRELEQCVRNVLVRGEYQPLKRAEVSAGAMAGFLAEVRAGRLSLERLTDLYITLVYRDDPNYVHAAEALGIDRRTVKARIDQDFLRGLDEEG